jgi:hypothetical protein
MLLNQRNIANQLGIHPITLYRRLKDKFKKTSPGKYLNDSEVKQIEKILDVKIKTE